MTWVRTLPLLGMAWLCQGQTDLIAFHPESTLKLAARADVVVFSSDGTLVVVATRAGAFVEDVSSGTVRQFAEGPIHVVAISRDDRRVAAGSESGEIIVAGADGAPSGRARIAKGSVLSISFSPDGGKLVTAAADKGIEILDTGGHELSRLQNPANKPFVFVGFSAQDNSVVGLSETGLILEWDPGTGKIVRQMQDADTTAFAGTLNGEGGLLAISTEVARLSKGGFGRQANPADFYRRERVAIYDLSQGKLVKEFDGLEGQHKSLSFSADSHYLSAGREKVKGVALSVYDVQRGVEVESTGAQSGSLAAAFSPDGKHFAQANMEGGLAFFQVNGVQRGGSAGDLRGTKYQITSKQTAPLLAPAEPMRLAVMDLEVNGGDKDLGRSISDLIRNRINGSKNITVIERRQWQQLITEQNVQMSDRIDPLTAVRLGKGIGVRKMVFGSVNKLGTTYTINVRMVDVETLQNEGEREILCQRCELEDLPGAVALLKTALVKD